MADRLNGGHSTTKNAVGHDRDGSNAAVRIDDHDASWIFDATLLENPPTLTLRTQYTMSPVSLQQEQEWRREAVGHIQTTVGRLGQMKPPVEVPGI